MVVQEFLQRRREPWRWAWCLAIPSWQLPTESHHCKLTVTNWDPSLKVIFLQLHKKLLKNSMSIILRLSGIWSKLERWKSFRVWHELTANQKNRCLEVLSSLFCATTTNHFLIRLQLLMTSSVVGPRRSSKALPKPNLHQKKGHGHYLVVCCWSDPLQLSESWQNQYMWEICSANWWDALKTATPAADIGQRKGLILLHNNAWPRHTTNASKVEWIGLQSFASSAVFTWSLNWPQLLQASRQLFVWKMLPQPAEGRKCFQRVC